MVANVETTGVADIALREIIEDKMGFDMPEIVQLARPTREFIGRAAAIAACVAISPHIVAAEAAL